MYAQRHSTTGPIWKQFVDSFVARPTQLVMFSKSYSPECIICKRSLRRLACVTDDNFFSVEIEKRSDCTEIESYLLKLSGNSRRQVPLFFLGGYFVGGYQHIISAEMEGRLKKYMENLLHPPATPQPRCPAVCGLIQLPRNDMQYHLKISTDFSAPPEPDEGPPPALLLPETLRERANSLKKGDAELERAFTAAVHSDEQMATHHHHHRHRRRSRPAISPFQGDADAVSVGIASLGTTPAPLTEELTEDEDRVTDLKSLFKKWQHFETSLEQDLGVVVRKKPSLKNLDYEPRPSVKTKTVAFHEDNDVSEESSDSFVAEMKPLTPTKQPSSPPTKIPLVRIHSSNVALDKLGRERYTGKRKSMFVQRPGAGNRRYTDDLMDQLREM